MEQQNKVEERLKEVAGKIAGGYLAMAIQDLVLIVAEQQVEIQKLQNRADGIVGELEYQQGKIDQLFNPGKQMW